MRPSTHGMHLELFPGEITGIQSYNFDCIAYSDRNLKLYRTKMYVKIIAYSFEWYSIFQKAM
jgi:hypothetical protein